jgi:urease gamma subunit
MIMEKKQIIEEIHEKVKAASFNDYGKAVLSMEGVADGQMIIDVLDELKSDTSFDFDFDLDKMLLTVHNPDDDLDGFARRHPSPQKCK